MYKKLEIEKNGNTEDVCKYENDKECLEHVIEQNLNCSVPWNFNETRSAVRPCNDEKDLQRGAFINQKNIAIDGQKLPKNRQRSKRVNVKI